MEPLHIGLVGCGRWGRFILRDLLVLGCQVSVAARSSAGIANARQTGATTIVPSIEELPRSIDGAIVATQTYLHAEAIERLLPRQIPIFCEKALTADLPSAQRLLSLAPDRIFVMDKWRYHPGIEALAAIARSAELGPVRSIRTTRLGWATSHADVDPVWILAPHDLSIILEILGYIPDPRAAAAHAEHNSAIEMSALLGDAPYALLSVSARHHAHQRSVTLCCAEGSAALDDSYSTHLIIRRAPGGRAALDAPTESRPLPNDMPLLLELAAFLNYLRGGAPPRSSAADAVRVVAVLERLRRLAGLPHALRP